MMARPETTLSEIRSWNYRNQSRIGQAAPGSHARITIRLDRVAYRLWSTTIGFVILSLLLFTLRAIGLFLCGRAAWIIDAASKAH